MEFWRECAGWWKQVTATKNWNLQIKKKLEAKFEKGVLEKFLLKHNYNAELFENTRGKEKNVALYQMMAHFLKKFSWQNKQLKQNKVVHNFLNRPF